MIDWVDDTGDEPTRIRGSLQGNSKRSINAWIEVDAPIHVITMYAEQLLWILTTFRGLSKGKLMESRTTASYSEWDGAVTLHMQPRMLEVTTEAGHSTCWHHTFRRLPVAMDFPIPDPPKGAKGVEVPLAHMVVLSQVEYPVQYLNSFVLKGSKTALLPIDYWEDPVAPGAFIVQWHLVKAGPKSRQLSMEEVHAVSEKLKLGPRFDDSTCFNMDYEDDQDSDEEGEDVGYFELSQSYSGRSYSDASMTSDSVSNQGPLTVNASMIDPRIRLYNDLVDAVANVDNRHFLGQDRTGRLYQEALIHLGTSDADTRNIASFEDSPASNVKVLKRGIVWKRNIDIGITLGVPGVPIGLGFTAGFEREGQLRLRIENEDIQRIEKACQNLSILYDTDRRVAWLVPEMCAIMHLM